LALLDPYYAQIIQSPKADERSTAWTAEAVKSAIFQLTNSAALPFWVAYGILVYTTMIVETIATITTRAKTDFVGF